MNTNKDFWAFAQFLKYVTLMKKTNVQKQVYGEMKSLSDAFFMISIFLILVYEINLLHYVPMSQCKLLQLFD